MAKSEKVYQPSIVAELLPGAIKKYSERVAEVWTEGSAAAADETLKEANVNDYEEYAALKEKEEEEQRKKEIDNALSTTS